MLLSRLQIARLVSSPSHSRSTHGDVMQERTPLQANNSSDTTGSMGNSEISLYILELKATTGSVADIAMVGTPIDLQ